MKKTWTNKSSFLDYLKKRRVQSGQTQEGLSRRMGLSHSYMHHVEKRGHLPGPEVLIKLAHIFGDDPEDYLSMRSKLDAHDQSTIIWQELLAKEPSAIYKEGGGRRIPVINLTNCGTWNDFTDKDYPTGIADEYIMAITNDDNAFYVRAEGDSMEPEIRHGDLVLIEPNRQVENGDFVFARTDEGCLIKKLHITSDNRLQLLSLNPKYPPIDIKRKRGFRYYRVSGKHTVY